MNSTAKQKKGKIAPDHKVFLAVVPPTTTHQAKKLSARSGFVKMHDTKKLTDVIESYESLLKKKRNMPTRKFEGPIRVKIKFVFPYLKSTPKKAVAAGRLIPKITKPDWDNMSKTLTDVLTKTLWIRDDCIIYSGTCEKWVGPDSKVGVYIKIYEWKG